MDWNNINLNDAYERSQFILDGLSFDDLLLDIHCNVPDINREEVIAQFNAELAMRIESAKEVFEANLDAIVDYAIAEREEDTNSEDE